MRFRAYIQFWHEVLRDHVAIERVTREGSYDEFIATYKRIDRNIMYGSGGRKLLSDALSNNDIASRIKIANKLLDDGADVRLGNPLIIYRRAHDHDFESEQPLLRRIIELGTDINRPLNKWGTPLIALASMFRFKGSVLIPFYDIYFAQDDLNLSVMSGPAKHSYSAYNQIQKIAKLRPELLRRADAHLITHNRPKLTDAL
ncbi:hypothetical protein H7097_03400 [Aeromicrobium sp.]|nr:hypothetical protein [Candidatus Saccharibacteria bacterium]